MDALSLALWNRAATDLEAKAKQLLLGVQVLLKECCLAAFRIAFLVLDCNWASRDPGGGKNWLAVLDPACLSCLPW